MQKAKAFGSYAAFTAMIGYHLAACVSWWYFLWEFANYHGFWTTVLFGTWASAWKCIVWPYFVFFS